MKLTGSAVLLVCAAAFCWAQDSANDEDSAKGLPSEYAKKYLLAARSVSPDGKVGVMYPRTNVCTEGKDDSLPADCKDFVVALKPFKVLAPLQTKYPHFQNRSNSGLDADWLRDSSAALVTIQSKWGPGEIFLIEVKDGAVTRTTNLLTKINELLEPDFKKAKPPSYNDNFRFIIEGETRDICRLEQELVRITAVATTDPKHIPGQKAWDARVEAVWNIPKARFQSKQVLRLFSGVRKESE